MTKDKLIQELSLIISVDSMTTHQKVDCVINLIKDLQREAFEAGRNYFNRNVYNGYEFATFEDYLKNLENE